MLPLFVSTTVWWTVLGSINDTCIMIRILILKKYQVSSIMIHFWYSISISITDTFRVYQYHKSLIHDCDTFTGIQNSLLTRFASRELFIQSVTTVSRIQIPHQSPCFLETNHEAEDDFFDCSTVPSTDSAVSAVDRECINYLSDTQTLNWKCWQDTVEPEKFSSNSTQLYHRLHHSSKKTVQHGWTDRSATPQSSEWLEV